MGNLFSSLRGATDALQVFGKAMATIQNNVTNISTPGFAKQVQTLSANRFALDLGLAGGVTAGQVISYRSEYAEQSVRRQQESYGAFDQQASDLSRIQPVFDISNGAGIPGALSNFFSSWSSLAASPNNATSRQTVLDRAGEVARSFRETANSLTNADLSLNAEIKDQVTQFNQLADQLAKINAQCRTDFHAASDSGVDSQVHTILEQMSQVVNTTALKQGDGTYMVLVGGQTPVVVGDKAYAMSADLSGSPALLRSAQGADITNQVTGGRLSATLSVKNTTVPSLRNGLNTLAENFADAVNAKLSAGVDQNGLTPVNQLFTYDSTNGAALTLTTTGITAEELAAARPEAPGGNANALDIAAMATAKQANGTSFSEQFAQLASKIGRDLNTAKNSADTHNELLSQAQAMRSQLSGVSLDEEASHLVEFQRNYQAASKLVTIINQLTDTLINMI